MQKVVVLGAGKSSGVLIRYLAQRGIDLLVADANQDNVQSKTEGFPHVRTFLGDITHPDTLTSLVKDGDVIVSLLPPHLHVEVAKICLAHQKQLVTASYASEEMLALDGEAQRKGVLILMECGLDPGIDHMSALQLIDRLKAEGARITSFQSYCGGLVAPESDDNPWGYKVTWNPRNVVLAGQGTAQFLEDSKVRLVPYQQLFKRTVPLFFEKYGEYEAYPNRDSLSYIPLYQLNGIENFVRGTIRKKGFCQAWDRLVYLGLTEDHAKIGRPETFTFKELVSSFLPKDVSLAQHLTISEKDEVYKKLIWLGLQEEIHLFDTSKQTASPAEFLQKLIEKKWELKDADKDLVLMQHLLEYDLGGNKKLRSTLTVEGENTSETAMAKTVGLPLAIATMLIVAGNLRKTGVQRPVIQEIYEPILNSLKREGIIFREYA